MLKARILSLLTALLCLAVTAFPALAAQIEGGSVYCFTREDFIQEQEPAGICITELPESWLGYVSLGDRVLRPGDVLTADQLALMTFSPLDTEEDLTASVTYLPIYDGHAAAPVTMTIAIRGKEDQSPVAEDSAYETYKNLPLEGKLKVHEPEEQAMTFTVTRSPRRGEVTISSDGSFTYTPKKNKVGTDSFTYTATDEKGHVSREATVTIQILKPTDAPQYTDTLGRDCRFAAEWMKHTGIFLGEQLDDNSCFQPDKAVSRGEFITMLVKSLDLPVEKTDGMDSETDVPDWLKPYLAAALRSGLTDGLPSLETADIHQSITGAEAAVMLQNVLDLNKISGESGDQTDAPVAVWAEDALAVMADYGFPLCPDQALTREQAALCLYLAHQLAPEAPGITALRAAWNLAS